MAEGSNPTLAVDFRVNLAEADKDIESGKKKIAAMGAEVQKTGGAISGGLTNAAAGAAGIFGRLAAAVAGVGLVSFASKAGETAANLERGARSASMSLEAYQRLSNAFKSQGASSEAASAGLATFSRTVALARLKTGELYETLKFIAPALAEQLTQTKTTEDALAVYAEAIRRVVGDSNKAALATKGFGDAGIDLLPVLSKGAAGVAEMTANSSAFIQTTGDASKAAKAAKTEWGLFADAILSDVANKMAPANEAIGNFFKGVRESAAEHGGFLEAIKARWDDVSKAAVAAADGARAYSDAANNLKPLNLLPIQRPGEWKTSTQAGDAITLQPKPDFRGADAVAASRASLAAARGDQMQSIKLEADQQIEQARRLVTERVLSEKEFGTIRANLAAASNEKVVALNRDMRGQLRELEIAALTAEQNGFAVISLEYERDLERYTDMARKKLISEEQLQAARANINRVAAQKIAEENSKLGDKIREQTSGYASAIEGALGNALNGTFTNGKDAARSFFVELIQGLQRATMQALILKPLMESLTGKSTTSGATGDATGGILGSLSSSLGSIFGLPQVARAEGGGLRAGVPTLINERAGRMGEVFVPEVAGRMVPGERAASAAGASGAATVSNVYHIDARNADAGVERRLRAMLVELERNRQSPVAALAQQRRQFPMRAA